MPPPFRIYYYFTDKNHYAGSNHVTNHVKLVKQVLQCDTLTLRDYDLLLFFRPTRHHLGRS
jgi:hypothetical protein